MPECPPKFYKNPSIAVVLSFFWPGLGQIYNGQIGKGICFLVAAGISALLMWVLIGFLLYPVAWIWGMVDAHNSAKQINDRLAAE
jgi:TM2 domain-containing membrane protein YozV